MKEIEKIYKGRHRKIKRQLYQQKEIEINVAEMCND